MPINLNPTSERGASRDAVNRPRETLGDSHLISSDPRSRFGLVCDLLCCPDNMLRIGVGVTFVVRARGNTHHHDTRRVGGEIHVEVLLDQSPETLGEEVFDDRLESSSIPKTGQAVTAAIGDFRCIGEDLGLEPRAECLLDEREVIGVAVQLCRGNGRLVQH